MWDAERSGSTNGLLQCFDLLAQEASLVRGLGYSIAGIDLSLNWAGTDISPSGDGNEETVRFSGSRSF